MNQDEKPQTNQPDFAEAEKQVLEYWETNKIFERSLEQTQNGEPFVFYDGPPFATGLPHYGHILTSVIKDAVPRFQTMRGRFVRRKWGWDCHGLPIENIVEKKLGISGKKQIEELGVDKFNQACRESVWGYEKEWGQMVKRIGRWVDFDHSYKTMDSSYQESVWWALKQLWEKRLIYEDRKVLLYCGRCETPISNFEVAMDNSYKDVTENSVFVKFRLLPHQRVLDFITDEKTFMLAWTTTPWTLPANTALNIGPEIAYVIVEAVGGLGERYILAKDKLEVLTGEYEILREVSARSLEGLRYEPLYVADLGEGGESAGKAYRVYPEEFVTTEDGTGVVHNAVMYGEEDFLAGKKRGLPRVEILNHQGHFKEGQLDFLVGKFFKSADKAVLEDLSGRGLVYKVLPFTHSYPHCYRCSTPLYYTALPSWFIDIQKIKSDLLKSNENIQWYPDHLKYGRFAKSMEQAPDWNISRNRFWATALPFWRCENASCREVVCVGSVQELAGKAVNFSDIYPDYESYTAVSSAGNSRVNHLDLHKPYIDRIVLRCEKCVGEMRRVPEVVDCWVESGSMPFAELHYPFEANDDSVDGFKARFPADFVVEYTPQTRAWFYVMHVINTLLFGNAPFKNVLCHGTILAEDGSKMSKSKANYPDPNLLLDKYGSDALRFALLMNPISIGEDSSFAESQVKDAHQKINTLLYNVWQFYRMYEKTQVALPDLEQVLSKNVLDVWILERLRNMIVSVSDHLSAYNTVKSARAILEFVDDLSTWYVRRSRERIKYGGEESKNALVVLGVVLREVAKVLAPFTPFLAERIYRDLTGQVSVHLAKWQDFESFRGQIDSKVFERMNLVREVVSLGLSLRKQGGIPVRQPLRSFAFALSEQITLSAEHLELVLAELNVKAIADFDSLKEVSLRKGGVVISSGSGKVLQVALTTEIDAELAQEGMVRELERAVQDLRKKSGLSAGDIIELYYNTQDVNLLSVINSLDLTKLSVRELKQDPEVEMDFEVQVTIAGHPLWIGLVKV